MADVKNKKKGALSKEISLGKKSVYPTKTTMNFIHDEVAETNRKSIIGFVIFLVFLAIFVKFAVLNPMNKVNEAEARYNELNASLEAMRGASGSYNDVQSKYDELVGSYLTDEEQASLNRPDILKMVDEDIIPSVSVKSIVVSGNQVSVITDTTRLETVGSIIAVLQSDERNSYATVTTTAASGDDTTLVTADFEITFASTNTGEESTGEGAAQ